MPDLTLIKLTPGFHKLPKNRLKTKTAKIFISLTCVASGCTETWLGWASLDSEWTVKLTKKILSYKIKISSEMYKYLLLKSLKSIFYSQILNKLFSNYESKWGSTGRILAFKWAFSINWYSLLINCYMPFTFFCSVSETILTNGYREE